MNATKKQFDAFDWQSTLVESQNPLCENYALLFHEKVKIAQSEGNSEEQETYTFLYRVTRLRLDPYSTNGPFQPHIVGESTTPIGIDEFDDKELQLMVSLMPEIENSELLARFADILWTRRFANYQTAEIAIESYIQSANNLIDVYNNRPTLLRYERALQIAVGLGRNNTPIQNVQDEITKQIKKRLSKDTSSFTANLSILLYVKRLGDAEEQVSILETIANRCDTKGDYETANMYWELCSKWSFRSGNEEAAKESQIKAAECWYKLAKIAQTPSIASSYYTRSIMTYRQIPGTEERRDALHQLLLKAQQESVSELGLIKTNFGNGKVKNQARKAVNNKTIKEAIKTLAFITETPTIKDLEEEVKASAQIAPFQALLPSAAINAMGKVIGLKPSPFEDEDVALLFDMHRTANSHRHYIVVNLIEPAREEIISQHFIRIHDIFYFLNNNPFVPPSRIPIYARGLYAGFYGDFILSTHLLIPQLEESMRHLLRQKGVITSGMDSYLIQHERDLNVVLSEPQYRSHIVEMIGEDLTFDLQGLLIDARGANLRNDVSHGLFNYEAFLDPQSIYLWWIILRLCCLWYIIRMPEDSDKSDNRDQPNEEN